MFGRAKLSRQKFKLHPFFDPEQIQCQLRLCLIVFANIPFTISCKLKKTALAVNSIMNIIKYGIESQSKLIKSIQIFLSRVSFFIFIPFPFLIISNSSFMPHSLSFYYIQRFSAFHYNSREKKNIQCKTMAIRSFALFFQSFYIFTDS